MTVFYFQPGHECFPEPPRLKPHYDILDGLRGVAALLVVAFHLFETYSGSPVRQIINHGYLAVDFFYVLSGFVVGYAYDDRWGRTMGLRDFFKRRLVRLHPLYVWGTLLGLLLYYAQQSPAFPVIGTVPWWQVLLVGAACCCALPMPVRWDVRGWTETNPLNGAAWSLLWEYVANVFYAIVLRRLSRLALGALAAGAALCTLDLTLNLDMFGLLTGREPAVHTVIGGWSLAPTQLYIGATRLAYPFLAGLLLSRVAWRVRLSGGFWWCSAAVVVLLAMPRVGAEARPWLNGVYEAACILVVFPLVVAAGAGSRLTDARSAAVCRFLGRISYPLYITHLPIVYLQIAWASLHPDAPTSAAVVVSVGLYLFAIFVAYASMRLVDEPLRALLARRWLRSPGARAGGAVAKSTPNG